MKTLLLTIAGALLLGTWTAWDADWMPWNEARGADRPDEAVFRTRRGPLKITVTENGYLKAENSENLQPKYRGQNTITFLIDEGTEVEEGDVLVEFDPTELETQLENAQTNLIQHQAELEAAQANLAIQERENTATIGKAELALEVAELTLKRYNEGEFPNTLRKNQLAVEKADSEHKRAAEAYKQVPSLFEEGFLTSIQAEEERIRVKEAEINLENAKKELELYENLTRPMELKQKEAAVRDAERDLETARQRAEINMKEKKARVSQYESTVQSTKSRIEELERYLGFMTLEAPRGGVVIYGDPRNSWSTNQVKVGNTVWQGMTVITLPDLTSMQVLIDVHEADISKLAVDQTCTITIDTYKGRIFTGKVTDVASVANSGNYRDPTNKKFRVEVAMDEVEDELRAGVTAKVEVLVEELEDVLQVPIHAVFKEGEEFVCFQPGAEGFERRTVEIGKSNEHYVEVVSGLGEGDPVLLYDPREEREGEGKGGGADDETTPGLAAAAGGEAEA